MQNATQSWLGQSAAVVQQRTAPFFLATAIASQHRFPLQSRLIPQRPHPQPRLFTPTGFRPTHWQSPRSVRSTWVRKNVGGLSNVTLTDLAKDFDLTPDKIEQINMLVFPPAEKGHAPGKPATIVRLKAPAKIARGGEATNRRSQRAQRDEIRNGRWRLRLGQVDPQTLLVARRLLDNGPMSKSALVKSPHWQALSGQALVAGIDVIANSQMGSRKSPPFNEMLKPLWTDVSQLYVAGRSDDALKLVVFIQGREGSSLQKTKETLTAARSHGKTAGRISRASR